MPPWKYRRILIYFTCLLAAGMIVFAAGTYRSDTQVATQLIVGGVALLSITLTAYTGFATYEDTKLWKQAQNLKDTIYPETEEDNGQ